MIVVPDVGAAFDAGRDHFLRWSPLLWDPLGARLVEAAGPRPGAWVLDACCGAGASALPAAAAVGPTGRVDAVDLAASLVDHGRALAADAGLAHLRFARADVTTWRHERPYDLVQCAYGIFFLPDLDRDGAGLVRQLRPGGRLAALVWQRGGMERIPRIVLDLVRTERPDLPEREDRSRRVDTAESFAAWMKSLGLVDVRVETVPFSVPLDTPQDPDRAWSLVIGTILRTTLDGLSSAAVERIRRSFPERLAAERLTTLDATSLLGIGTRP